MYLVEAKVDGMNSQVAVVPWQVHAKHGGLCSLSIIEALQTMAWLTLAHLQSL